MVGNKNGAENKMKTVKIGEKVVINDLPEPYIFTVTSVHHVPMITISYRYASGDMQEDNVHISLLRKPTKKQLANGKESIYV